MQSIQVTVAKSVEDIQKCTRVIRELRPHLSETEIVEQVLEMMQEGYQLAFVEEHGVAMSAVGYRYLQFLFCGKHFYIDDLVTLPEARGKGYAGALLDFVHERAREAGFKFVTLDSGHHRHDAHRLYLNKGYAMKAHHFIKEL